MATVRIKNVSTDTIFLERYLFWEPGEVKDVDVEVLERQKDGLALVEGRLVEVTEAPAAPADPVEE